MANLSEQDISSQFIGLSVNSVNLMKCAQRNGTAMNPAIYIVYSCGFLYKQELMDLFGVTAKLKEQWERRGTASAKASCNPMKCTQQELHIAKRILDYVTK